MSLRKMKNSSSFSQIHYDKCMENTGMAVCFGTARPVTMNSLALTPQNGGPCFEITGWADFYALWFQSHFSYR